MKVIVRNSSGKYYQGVVVDDSYSHIRVLITDRQGNRSIRTFDKLKWSIRRVE